MATVRKRKLPSGLVRWQVSYVDGAGKRRAKQFVKRSEADAWLTETRHDLARGLHTPDSISPTVREAGAMWIKRCHEKGLEPATIRNYEEYLRLHIIPLIGGKKLAELTAPAIYAFADRLREDGRSPDMVRRVIRSLGAIFREARRRGLSSTDPTVGLDLHLPSREDPRAVAPTKAELQAIISAASGRWRPLILVAIFCGLRASEPRGLRWSDIDFEARHINVTQRADIYNKLGRLKSKSAYRSIPCPPLVLNALREWKLVCPKGNLGLAFPSGAGNVESLSNIMQRGLDPIQVTAGVSEIKPALDEAGQPVVDDAGASKMMTVGKYGMHALRHACASLWIEQGMNPKRIQKLMGHGSIQMTFDRYGHWFADTDADQRAAEDIQTRLLGK
jgi:integrase